MAGGNHTHAEEAPKPTKEVCDKAGIPYQLRDACAGYLIKLNECRHQNLYLPWRCQHERHAYEKCEYKEFLERIRIQQRRMQEESAQ